MDFTEKTSCINITISPFSSPRLVSNCLYYYYKQTTVLRLLLFSILNVSTIIAYCLPENTLDLEDQCIMKICFSKLEKCDDNQHKNIK